MKGDRELLKQIADRICNHGSVISVCRACADAEIARLTRELEEARSDLKLAAGTTIEDVLLVPRGALSQLRAERDEARQALNAERAECERLRHDVSRQAAALSEANTECEQLRDERADWQAVMLRSFDMKASYSTDLYTWISCKLAEIERLRALAAEGGEG